MKLQHHLIHVIWFTLMHAGLSRNAMYFPVLIP
jgi:hypothetical protein